MKNAEIADIFAQIADLLEILAEDVFRVSSYRKVARVLAELAEPIEKIAAAGRLEEVPGIGKSSAGKINQYLADGKIVLHEELKAKVPPNLTGLLEVSGLGPKTVAKLWKQGGITSVEQLKEVLAKDPARLTEIEGLGPKKVQQIAESLAFLESAGGRIRLDQAEALATGLIQTVSLCKGARRVTAAGSLRRGKETIGNIDLLCQASPSAAEAIIESFASAPAVRRVVAKGGTKGSVVLEGEVQADLRVVAKDQYGSALAYFSGSKAHNVRLRELAVKKGLKLSEYGLFRGEQRLAGADEEGIYAALGLPFVPPELREDRGEIEAAIEGELPRLLELSDIRGDLHMHTTASDGLNSIEEMIDACHARRYQYMVISEHSKAQVQARGLDEKRLAEHAAAVRKAAGKHKDILVLVGIEVDVFKDGSLDFAADVLAELDFVTASAHSALNMAGADATRRYVRAIEHPHVHCIGHPSGRLINSRPGMEIDIDRIADAAAANHVALEINAHPYRLDLRDTHVRAAIQRGASLAINTDAHSTGDLDYMRYGVITARRGWAQASNVINTLSPAELKKWIAQKG
jgi:DNA polymerase (family 10)